MTDIDDSGFLQGVKNRIAGGAFWVAAGIFLSRIAGLVRERVFANYFGNSDAAGAFRVAMRIPNFLQNLLGEGALSASFIPVYARLLAQHDEKTAGRVAGGVASLLALIVSLWVLLGVLIAPLLVRLVVPGFQGELQELTVRLVRILFPGVGILVLSAWCLGILNSHRKFFLSYVAPVFWNLAMIVTMVIFGAGYGQFSLAVALAWGAVAGSAFQFGIQLPFVLRYERALRLTFDTTIEPVWEVFRNLGPMVMSRGVVQVSAYIDVVIASFLGAGAVAGLGYAQMIYLLPISLFGMSIAAAELPEMSQEVGPQDEVSRRLRERLASAKRKIAFFVIPSVVSFIFLGRYLVAGLFETGRFGMEDTRYVWYILIGPSIGLLAATWGRLYSSAFYALRDTRTPLRFALIRVTVAAILGILFAFPLRSALIAVMDSLGLSVPNIVNGALAMGAVGLGLSTGIAGWIEYLLLRSALTARIGPIIVPVLDQARIWECAIFAVAVTAICASLCLPILFSWLPAYRAVVGAGVICGIFALTYLGATFTLRIH